MADQLSISESGEIIAQPLTWDGEPMFSPDTVREPGSAVLFSTAPYAQLRGQTALDTDGAQ